MSNRVDLIQGMLDAVNKAGRCARMNHIQLTRAKGFKKRPLLQIVANHYYDAGRVNYEVAAFLESLLLKERRK